MFEIVSLSPAASNLSNAFAKFVSTFFFRAGGNWSTISAMIAASGRVTLTFPSPYLRNAPTMLSVEAGEPAGVASWRREEVTSYESGFKRELIAFHDALTTGAPVETNGVDATRDIAMCQSIIRCVQTRAPIPRPTDY